MHLAPPDSFPWGILFVGLFQGSRQNHGDDFQQSIQNVSSMRSAEKDMGPYYPVSSYSSKLDFEAQGCNFKRTL